MQNASLFNIINTLELIFSLIVLKLDDQLLPNLCNTSNMTGN